MLDVTFIKTRKERDVWRGGATTEVVDGGGGGREFSAVSLRIGKEGVV